MVVFGSEDKDRLSVWTYDVPANKWTKLDVTNSPSSRGLTTIAYDADSKVILLHGVGNNGRDAGDNVLNDTWVLDLDRKEWKEIQTPGPPLMKGIRERAELLHRQALAYDAANQRFQLDLSCHYLSLPPTTTQSSVS